MRRKKTAVMALAAVMTALLFAGGVLAHSVFFACWDNRDGTLSCEGGYTDGSSAEGATVNVTDAAGRLIFSGKLDKAGELRFSKPAGEFKVTLDGGLGHMVVIESKDIK